MRGLIWPDERDALILHDRLLALHGGAAGMRDNGLLASTLARPRQHFSYGEDSSVYLSRPRSETMSAMAQSGYSGEAA